ncbi:MAG: phosphate ABC transporter permease PstA [Chloroflexi bacterium]|nr:phosphate ABC transporter permease PstA [Chloroflexota bacterium]
MKTTSQFNQRLAYREAVGKVLYFVFLSAVLVGIIGRVVLLAQILIQGLPWLSWHFLSEFPSRHAEEAGLLSALAGTIWLMVLTAALTVPIGVGAAIYLEEYTARNNRLARLAKLNIANLAGVPSIVYGLLGLAIFVRGMHMGQSVLAGGFTLALLVLPIIIVAAGEALRAVPASTREGAFALGATRWQVIWNLVLPQAFPGILTGVILAVSRAIGETAPLIVIGALTFVPFTPDSPFSRFSALPIQIFNWTARPQAGFQEAAAAGIIVLLVALLVLNAGAVFLRNKFQNRDGG